MVNKLGLRIHLLFPLIYRGTLKTGRNHASINARNFPYQHVPSSVIRAVPETLQLLELTLKAQCRDVDMMI